MSLLNIIIKIRIKIDVITIKRLQKIRIYKFFELIFCLEWVGVPQNLQISELYIKERHLKQ